MTTRHERVVIDLDDRLTKDMAGMAAATSLLRKNLDDSGRSVIAFDKTTRDTSPSIDKLSGRLSILTRAAAALGPGFVPITTAAVPALAGLATQLGFAAAGAGTAVLAFNGVGDALGALNEYQLEPSAANFEKLQESMRGLGPAAREFVGFLDQIGPQLQTIREAAQEGLLPGVQDGIDSLLGRLPEVRRIVAEIADASGDLMAGAGAELAGSQWDEFFTFLEAEARPALTTLGQTVGNLAGGIAELWMALDPLSDDFASGLVDASAAFERWAAGLAGTESFEAFLAYVRETGPQVLDTLGSLASMLIDIGTAAAPLGGPVLAGIEAAADAISVIAKSDLGTPIMTAVAAMSALSLATKGWAAIMASTAATSLVTSLRGVDADGKKASATMRGLGAAAVGLGGLMVAAEGIKAIQRATDEVLPGVQELTSRLLALGDGTVSTIGKEFFGLEESLRRITDRTQDESITDALQAPSAYLFGKDGLFGEASSLRQARAEIEALDAAFANLTASGGVREAKDAFADFAQSQGLNAAQQKTLLGLMPRYKEALAGASNSADMAAGSEKRAAAATQAHTRAIQANLEAMRAKRNAALGAANAEIGYQQSLDDARRSLRENGKTLDITTDKGRANRSALLNQAAAWNAQSNAAKNTTGAHRAAIGAFVRTAVQMGMNADKARAYAKRLFEIPPKRSTQITLDAQAARANLAAYSAAFRGMDGAVARTHVINTTSHVDERLQRGLPGALGLFLPSVQSYAFGDVRNGHQPQIAPGSPVHRIWAEEETGGESYIPHANDHRRGRAVDIWERTGEILGVQFQRFAEGGKVDRFTDRERRQAVRGFNIRPGQGVDDVRDALREFQRMIREANGDLSRNFGQLSKQIVATSKRYDEHSRQLERNRDRLKSLRENRTQFAAEAGGSFNNDIFGNGVAGLRTQLSADTNDTRAMLAASRKADLKGLSGGLEKALLASGDLNTAQQISRMSRSQIGQLERQFAARASAQRSLGGFAGNEVFGGAIKDVSREIRELRRERAKDRRVMERLEGAVERGSEKGTRRGSGDKDRSARARGRRK